LHEPLSVRQLRVDGADARSPALRVAGDDAPLGDREPQLAAAALSAIRAPSAQSGRLRRRHTRPGLAELGWAARHRRAGTPLQLREALTATASALLSAARPAAEADHLVAETDRRMLTRRLAGYRDAAVVSAIAEREAVSVERQVELLDRVVSERASLAKLEPSVAEAIAAAEPRVDVLETVAERFRLRRRGAAAPAWGADMGGPGGEGGAAPGGGGSGGG
jgi:hypothetical protein